MVVAHCQSNIEWLARAVSDLQALGADVKDVHVYSKCGHTVDRPALPPAVAFHVTVLSNVGRNDHTFAFHIARRYHSLPDSIFFLKDSFAAYYKQNRHFHSLQRTVDEMAAALQSVGFACGRAIDVRVQPGGTVWHTTEGLSKFRLDEYAHVLPSADARKWDTVPVLQERKLASVSTETHPAGFRAPEHVRPLGAWLQHATHGDSPLTSRQIVPVCYGGVFASSAEHIWRTPQRVWVRLRDALERGDNIEEGHYMERSWAALLSPALPAATETALLCHVSAGLHSRAPFHAYAGLVTERVTRPVTESARTQCRAQCEGPSGSRVACRPCIMAAIGLAESKFARGHSSTNIAIL